MRKSIIIVIVSIVALCACQQKERVTVPMLSRAEILVDSLPKRTLEILDSVSRDSLKDYDLFMHCYLTVKAKQNMNEIEPSDSTILLMLEYAESHPKSVNYPEVLLYAGKYYRHKHEYATALQYLRKALEMLPEDEDDLNLRYRINVNYHSILTECGYHDEGYPFLLECIRISKLRNDSADLYYRYLDLSLYYQSKGDFKMSRELTDTAFSFLHNMTPIDSAYYRLELANIAHRSNNHSAARNYIHGVPETAEKNNRHNTHRIELFAARIYARAEVYDSAYYYARKIIDANDPTDSPAALEILFNCNAQNYIPEDSVNYFWNKWQKEYSEREAKLKEVRLSGDDNEKNEILELIIVGLIFISPTMILAVVVLILVVINLRRKLKYHQALTTIEILKKQIAVDKDPSSASLEEICEANKSGAQKAAEQRRAILDRIKAEMNGTAVYEPSPVITESEVMATLKQRIKEGKPLPDDSPLWDELKETVLKAHPNFVTILKIITDSSLTVSELRMALMIKAGISPTGMAVLSGKEKGTISSRRNSLGMKIFGQKLGVKAVDELIRNA